MIPKRPQHLTFINIKKPNNSEINTRGAIWRLYFTFHLNNIAVLTVIDLTQKNAWV